MVPHDDTHRAYGLQQLGLPLGPWGKELERERGEIDGEIQYGLWKKNSRPSPPSLSDTWCVKQGLAANSDPTPELSFWTP